MNLTTIDRQFINLIAHSPIHRDVLLQRLKHKSQLLADRRNRYTEIGKSFLRYFLLLFEILQTILKRSSTLPKDNLIFYEERSGVIKERTAYLLHHLPEKQFLGISYKDRITTLSNIKDTVILVLRMGVLLLYSFVRPSELGSDFVRITRICILLQSHVTHSNHSTVHLFRIYDDRIAFVAAYLKEHKITVNLVALTTPLTPDREYLIGSSLKLGNPYQRDEFIQYKKLGSCTNYEMWSPGEIHLLAPYYRSKEASDHINTIGLYTQGYWLRTRLGTIEQNLGQTFTHLEQELLEALLIYIQSSPHKRLKIYPHPMERRHFAKTGEHNFDTLHQYKQVDIDFSGERSIFSFDQIGLGITTMSTIGFDRIYMGYRTLFYLSKDIPLFNLEIKSPYNALFMTDKEELHEKIKEVSAISNKEFMQHFFGGNFPQDYIGD